MTSASFWKNKKILVTGGAGFLGSNFVEELKDAGVKSKDIFIVRSNEYDLTSQTQTDTLFKKIKPQIVVHLAGLVGGILANDKEPADYFYKNLMMGTNVLHAAWKHGAEKCVSAAAGCGYPEHAPVPLKEKDFWNGYPQPWSAPYSLAKRMLQIQSIAYHKQHGFKSVVCLPGNIYGPHDNFNLYQAHVIPALVRKFVEAAERGDKEIVVWGSGKPTRDFVHARDVARGMMLAALKYDTPELVNISSGVETSIKEVVDTLAKITNFKGNIAWDKEKPDGQLRRCFDMSKAKKDLGFKLAYDIRRGLKETVAWFKKNQKKARL